jgi:hypothetical protein
VKILKSSTVPHNSLIIPTLSDLCLALDESGSSTDQQKSLLNELIQAARRDGSPIHISNALAMEATFYANQQDFEGAIGSKKLLQLIYKADIHSNQLVKVYGKDRALEVCSQSILWHFLSGNEEQAVEQIKFVIHNYLPLQHPHDVTGIMSLLLPAILVLKFVGKARDALYMLGKYVVNPHHEFAPCENYWLELFNPIIYLLQILSVEEDGGTANPTFVNAVKAWVMDESNSYFSAHHLRMGHTLMGEICFQLGQLDTIVQADRLCLLEKAREFLTPIAKDVEAEPFLTQSATAIIQAMDD